MLKNIIIWKKYYEFISNRNIEEIKTLISKIPENNNVLKVVELDSNTNTFYFESNFRNGRIVNFEYRESYLYGKLTLVNENITRIQISVRPNSIYPFLFYLFSLIFLPIKISEFHNTGWKSLIDEIPFFLSLLILFLIGKYNTNKLLNESLNLLRIK